MLPTTTYQTDRHLSFAPVEVPHPRNAATVAHLRDICAMIVIAKICAKGRKQ